jgi:hypothetical protein
LASSQTELTAWNSEAARTERWNAYEARETAREKRRNLPPPPRAKIRVFLQARMLHTTHHLNMNNRQYLTHGLAMGVGLIPVIGGVGGGARTNRQDLSDPVYPSLILLPHPLPLLFLCNQASFDTNENWELRWKEMRISSLRKKTSRLLMRCDKPDFETVVTKVGYARK